MLRQEGRRCRNILELGSDRRRRIVFAAAGSDYSRGAFVMRAARVQSLVQLRRTGQRQRRQKRGDQCRANEVARLHFIEVLNEYGVCARVNEFG